MSLPQPSSEPSCCPSSVEDLRRQLHERLDQLIDIVLTQCNHTCFLDFEKRLLALLASLGQLLVQLFLLVRHQRLNLTAWLDKGLYRLADDAAERTLQTAFGSVRYSRAYLRHLMAAQEPLAGVLNTLHNLAYYLDTMRSVRNAIATDTLPALLARVRAQADRVGAG